MLWFRHPPRHSPQVAVAALGRLQNRATVSRAGDFENNRSTELDRGEIVEKFVPVYLPLSGCEVIIKLPAIVAGVHHPEMAGQFPGDCPKLARQIGVPGVDTDPDIHGIHGAQNPKQVLDTAGEQVGKHILKYEMDSEFAASLRRPGQNSRGVLHAAHALLFGKAPFLRAWVNHEVLHGQHGGRFGGPQNFTEGVLPCAGVE